MISSHSSNPPLIRLRDLILSTRTGPRWNQMLGRLVWISHRRLPLFWALLILHRHLHLGSVGDIHQVVAEHHIRIPQGHHSWEIRQNLVLISKHCEWEDRTKVFNPPGNLLVTLAHQLLLLLVSFYLVSLFLVTFQSLQRWTVLSQDTIRSTGGLLVPFYLLDK